MSHQPSTAAAVPGEERLRGVPRSAGWRGTGVLGAAALVLAALAAPDVALSQEAPTETMIAVPPVEGVPGPLFFWTPTLSFVPKGTVRVAVSYGFRVFRRITAG